MSTAFFPAVCFDDGHWYVHASNDDIETDLVIGSLVEIYEERA